MKSTIDLARELGREKGHATLMQFENPANLRAHYEGTAAEILRALREVDVFIAGIGTGGTLTGAGRRLKEANPKTRVIGVEPRFGEMLQGLRSLEEGYVPPLLDMNLMDGRFLVDAPTAFNRARALAHEEGILAGVSSGACLEAAFRVAERMDRGNIVVTFADGGWKYLPTYLSTFKPHDARADADDIAWW
jgi:cysteine synthase B